MKRQTDVLIEQAAGMSLQNQLSLDYNEALQSQIDVQREQLIAARRDKLLDLIYEISRYETNFVDDAMVVSLPAGLRRTKSNAVKEYVELERAHSTNSVDLSNAELSGISIAGANLRQVSLSKANLIGVELF